jgi:hypothetical protein
MATVSPPAGTAPGPRPLTTGRRPAALLVPSSSGGVNPRHTSASSTPSDGAATPPSSPPSAPSKKSRVPDLLLPVYDRRPVDFNGRATPKGDYALIHQLGKGAHGIVFLGQSMRDATEFKAVKVTKNIKRNMNEHTAMTALGEHANVVKMYDLQVSRDGALMFIIMDYVGGGELFDHIARADGGTMGEDTARRLFVDLLRGLGHCHDQQYVLNGEKRRGGG